MNPKKKSLFWDIYYSNPNRLKRIDRPLFKSYLYQNLNKGIGELRKTKENRENQQANWRITARRRMLPHDHCRLILELPHCTACWRMTAASSCRFQLDHCTLQHVATLCRTTIDHPFPSHVFTQNCESGNQRLGEQWKKLQVKIKQFPSHVYISLNKIYLWNLGNYLFWDLYHSNR